MTYVAFPSGQAVADSLGRGGESDLVALAGRAVGFVSTLVRSHTRERGFPSDGRVAADLAAVIVTAAARWAGNPEGLRSETAGPMAYTAGDTTGFTGWTDPERVVLDSWRRRTGTVTPAVA